VGAREKIGVVDVVGVIVADTGASGVVVTGNVLVIGIVGVSETRARATDSTCACGTSRAGDFVMVVVQAVSVAGTGKLVICVVQGASVGATDGVVVVVVRGIAALASDAHDWVNLRGCLS